MTLSLTMADSDAPHPRRFPIEPDPAKLGPSTAPAGFFDGLPATVWMTDTSLVVRFVEGMLLRRLNITQDLLLGRTVPDLLLDGREDHPLVQGHLTAIAGHENTVRIEWGGDIYSARLAPVRDTTGAVTGVVGVQQKIGWMPDDEGTLREADVRLRRAVDEHIAGIAFGNEDGQITDANDAFLELAGYAREDLTADGISWPALVPIEFHPRHLLAVDEVKRTGRCTPFETELIRRDGRRVPILLGGARLSARRREGVAFVVDLSASRRAARHADAVLACADRLLDAESATAAVAGVLAIVAALSPWCGAACWRAPDGADRADRRDRAPGAIARDGVLRGADEALEEIGRRAVAAGEGVWSPALRALGLPLAGAGGALIFAATPGRDPEPDDLATARAIAGRLARALARR